MTPRHALTVQVQNNPGVLARVAVLFARRDYNIDHLAVGPTADPTVSRMTIVVDCEPQKVPQVVSQLDRLVEVITIEQIEDVQAVRSRLLEANDPTAVLSTAGA
ncbi:acetolactate synthase small subunit [Kytococcus sp. Marseille-QA3725]